MNNYSRLVVICREGELEVVPFEIGMEEAADDFFDCAQQNWTDVYLCQVLKGPGPKS